MKHEITDKFLNRHIGISTEEKSEMLSVLGLDSIEQLIDETIPEGIRLKEELNLPEALSEFEYLRELKKISSQNSVFRSYLGLGYSNTIVPSVIKRNILENPGWYTQYTPYQAEISQGRLEALLNFQTMVSDLTGLPIANASLLDEGTAAAEAMIMFYSAKNKRQITSSKFFVSEHCLPQTIAVVRTRAIPLGIEVVIGNEQEIELDQNYFGILLQYPNVNGEILSYDGIISSAKSNDVYVTMACDIMSLVLLKSPAELGADCAVGNTQRFGVPLGFGGPHAAYFATTDTFKRSIPGRIIGISIDMNQNPALRMALQTREQHIKRDKATSNICTAQALLAIMAGMYVVYHGPDGLKNIATRIASFTHTLKDQLQEKGLHVINSDQFDTITIHADKSGIEVEKIREIAEQQSINFFYQDNLIRIALDETVLLQDLNDILTIFKKAQGKDEPSSLKEIESWQVAGDKLRSDQILDYPVFKSHHSESQMLRYMKSLENKDLSLTKSMIPLGSCTMKLNATTELEPISWPEFSNIHPFAPPSQTKGYLQIITELEKYLSVITGFDATSLQPNSGAQGEYAGLMVIREFHKNNGDNNRNIVLIPSSAHGTNPASAVMAGCKVIVVECDNYGNISVEDLEAKAKEHSDDLCALMVTYPSTHGVFEHRIKDVCAIVHQYGGQVYMDGANMNAQVGLTSPAEIGADVCHLNLHKTFAIPHGGGGPGMGPISVKEHLRPFLPSNPIVKTGGENAIEAISAAPWGSTSILLISYAYIRLLGKKGVRLATEYAILNANYIKQKLQRHFDVLYTGKDTERVAHELILDFRMFNHSANVTVEDIAKRLMDYGFHAPTVSFPVPGTIMIEPTESEDKAELDRFCEAMISIKGEIEEVLKGEADSDANVLKNAPHTLDDVTNTGWVYSYSREKAAFPLDFVKVNKFWPSTKRVNNSHGDRNLICSCPRIDEYREEVTV